MRLMTAAKLKMSTKPCLNGPPMSWGKNARPVRVAAWGQDG